jgi:hypothetical protein
VAGVASVTGVAGVTGVNTPDGGMVSDLGVPGIEMYILQA